MPKIFGREPALWLALVAVGVKCLTAFGLDVSTGQQAVINAAAAAIVGVIVAILVQDGISSAVLGLLQAGIALAVGFGLDWSADQQAVVMSAGAVLVAMFVRTQVTAPVSQVATAAERTSLASAPQPGSVSG